jgi:light-independent protochlorophyllide reductase subunit N
MTSSTGSSTRLLERRPDIKLLFLVGSCPSEVIKLDLGRAASASVAKFSPRVRVLNYSGSGIETTFTQGEDACLAAMVPELPEDPSGARSWSSARWPMSSRTSSRACSSSSASAGPLPAAAQGSRDLPRWARTPASCWPSPSSPIPARRWTSAAPAARRPLPAGRRGHDGLAQGRGRRLGSSPTLRRGDPAPPRERAEKALARYRDQLAGKRSSSSPIPSSNPARALPRRELGMQLVEVGTPYLHRQHLARNSRCCRRMPALSEGQDVERQLDRCREARPT